MHDQYCRIEKALSGKYTVGDEDDAVSHCMILIERLLKNGVGNCKYIVVAWSIPHAGGQQSSINLVVSATVV